MYYSTQPVSITYSFKPGGAKTITVNPESKKYFTYYMSEEFAISDK